MINYNPKAWFTLIFRFHKSDTFRILLPALLLTTLYAAAIAYLEIEIWQLRYKGMTTLHSLLGFVISLLLVFRTNTAYDRWWEGRRLWGSLLNNSRNLAIKINAILDKDNNQDRKYFKSLITNYGVVLKDHLRGEINLTKVQECKGFDTLCLEGKTHIPNHIAFLLFNKANELYKKNEITGDQLIVINEELRSFTDICGACERIKKTPIPYSYSLFLKKFIFIYVMTMPFGFVYDFGYWMIPIVILMFYVLASIELIAEEIENPFGNDANDLPLDEIAENINRSTGEILNA